VVAGNARLHVVQLMERLDDLVVGIIDHVAADDGEPVRGVDVDVHRSLGMAAGRLHPDAGADLQHAGDFEVEQAQCVARVQAVNQVLDVGRRILRMHKSGDGVFQLLSVHHDRGAHREQVVLAGVIDMQVRVHNETHVAEPQSMPRQLVLDHVLVELQARACRAIP
jgi:hypothetical protein